MMATVIFSLSVIIYEIFTIKICLALTLTFRMGKGQVEICQSKAQT